VKARQEAGGRRQEEDHYSIKTGFSITPILKVSQSFTTGSEDMEEGLEVGREEISFSPVVCLGRQ
jgi:hypothetical protein